MIRATASALVFSCLATSAWAQSPGVSGEALEQARQAMACGSLENSVGPWDYRTRSSNSRRSWDYNDNMTHHYQPAMNRMRAGEYTRPVIHDLDFLMRIWPNHHLGLQALIRYEEGGGKVHQYRTVECYLERARRFAPDDIAVLLIEANYFRKKKNPERARENYEEALRLQPASADVNYNAGLFYFELGEYSKALEHAHHAYSLGYPLPGLRRMLEAKGHWKEPAPEAAADPQPVAEER